ncbi:MAG: hypothetical protein ABIH69_00800 [bacterium]
MVVIIRPSTITQRRRVAAVRVDPGLKVSPQVKHFLSLHAASRGVYRVNIIKAQGALKFTRVTCVSMTIPIELLNYVLTQGLLISLLEQPSSIDINPCNNISGQGIILMLRGAEIEPRASFLTKPKQPIILSQKSTVASGAIVPAGTVVLPGCRFPQ